MALTPISGLNSYASPQDFQYRYDVRTSGELLVDDGTQVSLTAELVNMTLIALLQDASGEVESACLVAGRYAPIDLQNLNGNSKQFLIGLVCAIAAQRLYERRWITNEAVLSRYNWAQAHLTALRQGAEIFAFQEVVTAGVPKNQFMQNSDFQNLNLVSNLTRMMGIRQDRKRGGLFQ